ncbi:MAG: hypothetical protein H7840_05650 [Alphaproteobacteria bacterium]
MSRRPRYLFNRRRSSHRGRLAVAVMAAATVLQPASAVAGDDYLHQTYNMAGRGILTIVDFDYPSRQACVAAVGEMKATMARLHPTWIQTSATCSTDMTPTYQGLRDNRRADRPYVSFQDMRQWVDGVDLLAARSFCYTTASEPRFKGRAQCIE